MPKVTTRPQPVSHSKHKGLPLATQNAVVMPPSACEGQGPTAKLTDDLDGHLLEVTKRKGLLHVHVAAARRA